jgi:hypothetical protein
MNESDDVTRTSFAPVAFTKIDPDYTPTKWPVVRRNSVIAFRKIRQVHDGSETSETLLNYLFPSLQLLQCELANSDLTRPAVKFVAFQGPDRPWVRFS